MVSVPALVTHNLRVQYPHQAPSLWDVSLSIPQGTLTAIVGPNGAGKTTFLKALMHLIPYSGTITFFNTTYARVRARIAYVPQRMSVDWSFPISVYDVVLMGRYGHLRWFQRPTKQDHLITERAIDQVGLSTYAHVQIGALSGGQQQRVFLARALAQEADIYLLDEPFSGIDMPSETAIMQVLQVLKQAGKTIIVVHHDLQTLNTYFDWLVLINGTCIAHGTLTDTLTVENMQATYGTHTFLAAHFSLLKKSHD
jgi:manganese/zinc/iron transport system ATP- binding protein